MKQKAIVGIRSLPNRITKIYHKTLSLIDKKPLSSFFTVLLLLVLLIVASNIINKPKVAQTEAAVEPKTVDVYRIGTAPKVTFQAQTKKSGVIQVVALGNGVIQTVYHKEGDQVKKGDLLVGMSSNYQGGNLLSLQRQVAAKEYQNKADTYATEKEVLSKKREEAKKMDEDSDELRKLTEQSVDDTKQLVSLNQDILSSIDQNLTTLEEQRLASNSGLILAAKQLKSQFLSGTNQAKDAVRRGEYTSDSDNPPAKLSNIGKEITLKQLETEEKQLTLGKEISALRLQIAQVTEATMFPSAPFAGIIQRVLVKEKEVVAPGTPLLVISQLAENDPITAVAFVPREIAQKVSQLEPSILHIGNNRTITVNPSFVSTEAIQGNLYAIYYPLPDDVTTDVTNDGFITVDIPIGYYDTSAITPFIPLDGVYQTRQKAYVFVMEGGKAKSVEVRLGNVYGRYVEVLSGIRNGTTIILNRTVIDGDSVILNN